MLTILQAAAQLKVSESTIRRWIKAEILPAIRVGPRLWRIREEDLERLGK